MPIQNPHFSLPVRHREHRGAVPPPLPPGASPETLRCLCVLEVGRESAVGWAPGAAAGAGGAAGRSPSPAAVARCRLAATARPLGVSATPHPREGGIGGSGREAPRVKK